MANDADVSDDTESSSRSPLGGSLPRLSLDEESSPLAKLRRSVPRETSLPAPSAGTDAPASGSTSFLRPDTSAAGVPPPPAPAATTVPPAPPADPAAGTPATPPASEPAVPPSAEPGAPVLPGHSPAPVSAGPAAAPPAATDATTPTPATPIAPPSPESSPTAPAVPSGPALPVQTVAAPSPAPPTAAAFGSAPVSWEQVGSVSVREDRRSLGSTIARTIFGAIALAGLGVGARFAWTEIETRADDARQGEAALSGIPTTTRSTSATGVDVRLTITDLAETGEGISLNARTALASGDMTLDAVSLDALDTPVGDTVQVDRVGDSFLSFDPLSISWVPGDPIGAARVVDTVDRLAVRHTLSDVLPVEAREYAALVETATETLDLVPFTSALTPSAATTVATVPAPTPNVPSPGGSAPGDPAAAQPTPDAAGAVAEAADLAEQLSVAPTPVASVRTMAVTATRYRIEIDTAAFAAEEPVRFARWWDSGWAFLGTADVWIDDTGLLRRIRITESDGSTVDATWVAFSTGSVDALRYDDQAGS